MNFGVSRHCIGSKYDRIGLNDIEAHYTLSGGVLGHAMDVLLVRWAFSRTHLQMLEDLEHHLRHLDHWPPRADDQTSRDRHAHTG
ncbi:MAG: hypothetical protein ACI8RZ_005785 [Myxococcota bacterium]|jgi:hypothetical protein